MTGISFIVEGNPVPQARPRFTRQGHAYNSDKCKTYREHVALAAKTAMCGRGPISKKTPVRVLVAVFRARPKRTTNGDAPTTRPDIDNYAKMILDALNGIVFEDDSQVCEMTVLKKYGLPHVRIIAEEL